MKELYLDNAATTSAYPEVIKEIEKAMREAYGNPGSIHKKGEEAFRLISQARRKISLEINCRPEEIIFTSGATESNNLALFGLARAHPDKKKIIISSIEHPSVKECAYKLKEKGYDIVEIPVDREGVVDLRFLEKNIDRNTLVVSIIHVSNILGTIQSLDKIGEICRKKNVLFHTDAVQGFGKLKIDAVRSKIDFLSASGHKIGAPKGIGILYVRKGVKIEPIIIGGGQESGLRSGTENVPGILGFSKALEIQKKIDKKKIEKIRDMLIDGLERMGGIINGSKTQRIYNNVHVSFPGIDGEGLVLALSLKGIYVSSGSACESKKAKEDYVLKAIGSRKEDINSGIRITLGEGIGKKDADRILKEIERIFQKV